MRVIIIVLLRDKFLCSQISTLYLWLKPVKIVEHMDGTLAMTKKNILNTFKKLHKQLYKKFLMQYAWKIKFQKIIYIMIFTTIWYKIVMKIFLTINRYQELGLLRFLTKECSYFQNLREVIGLIVILLAKNAQEL